MFYKWGSALLILVNGAVAKPRAKCIYELFLCEWLIRKHGQALYMFCSGIAFIAINLDTEHSFPIVDETKSKHCNMYIHVPQK
jgi:hypothetical protein